MRAIDTIVIHCSATPAGKDYTARDIDRWHKNRGWKGIGYHFVIRLDGTIELGRPLAEVGAHVKGHNKHSIGICYIGGGYKEPQDTRTVPQVHALRALALSLKSLFPDAKVVGHRDLYAGKACPSFDVKSQLLI